MSVSFLISLVLIILVLSGWLIPALLVGVITFAIACAIYGNPEPLGWILTIPASLLGAAVLIYLSQIPAKLIEKLTKN
jgi:uncharacterized membrane protein YeaQ/YmgE (transglycosylase-associated protein family)